MATINQQQRLLELDALRGIAAAMVVLFHFVYRYSEIYRPDASRLDLFYYGNQGVYLFFIVSGFVIFWTLNRVNYPLDFIVSRFSRLYPVYWIALAITFAVVSYFGLPGREVSNGTAIANVLMFHSYLNIPHVDSVYWTLAVELTFYAWMFLLYLCKQLNRVEYFALPVVGLAMLQQLEILALPYVITQLLIMPYLPFFIAGICFFKMANNLATKATYIVLVLMLLSTLVLLPLRDFPLNFLFFIAFYGAINGHLSFLNARPLIFLGAISYSWYLLHQNIGYVVIYQLQAANINIYWAIAAALLISIGLAAMLTYLIERPIMRWIRDKYKNSIALQKLAKRATFSR